MICSAGQELKISALVKTDKQVMTMTNQLWVGCLSAGLVVQAFQRLCNKSQPSQRRFCSGKKQKDAIQARPVGRLCCLDCHWPTDLSKVTHLNLLHSCVSTALSCCCFSVTEPVPKKNNNDFCRNGWQL